MKEIPLRNIKKEIVAHAQVDDEDYEWLMQWRWRLNGGYASRCVYLGGGRDNQKSKYIAMHRQIMGITDTKIEVDHRDRVRLNNQRNNLRVATSSQQKMNKKAWGTSKYLGVNFDKARNKWNARIKANGIICYIGRFENEKDAAIARDVKARELHGEFANLNFPDS